MKVTQSAKADSDAVCDSKVRLNKETEISPSLVGLRVTVPPNRKPRLNVIRPLEEIVEEPEIVSSSSKAKIPGTLVLGLVVFLFTSVLQKTKKAGSHVDALTMGPTM